MPQINLLPWRDELRKRRNKEFGILAGVVAAAMLGLAVGVHLFFQGRIEFQQQRNRFLNQQISSLNKQIKAIKDLEKKKESLLARMKIIQELQSSRPEVVHLMDALVETLPEGVYYTRIAQKGARLSIDGVAQSNARVSSLMRKMDASEWLTNPALVEIKAFTPEGGKGAAAGQLRLSTFKLTVKQTRPKPHTDQQDETS